MDKMTGKMLNLEIGGFYKIKCGQGVEYTAQVIGKTIHDKTTHTYFLTWPNTGGFNPFGVYVWDTGVANKGYNHFAASDPIISCKRLTCKEKFGLIELFDKHKQQWKAFIVEPNNGKKIKNRRVLWKTSDKICYSTI